MAKNPIEQSLDQLVENAVVSCAFLNAGMKNAGVSRADRHRILRAVSKGELMDMPEALMGANEEVRKDGVVSGTTGVASS